MGSASDGGFCAGCDVPPEGEGRGGKVRTVGAALGGVVGKADDTVLVKIESRSSPESPSPKSDAQSPSEPVMSPSGPPKRESESPAPRL